MDDQHINSRKISHPELKLDSDFTLTPSSLGLETESHSYSELHGGHVLSLERCHHSENLDRSY